MELRSCTFSVHVVVKRCWRWEEWGIGRIKGLWVEHLLLFLTLVDNGRSQQPRVHNGYAHLTYTPTHMYTQRCERLREERGQREHIGPKTR